jgi:glutamyl-tRNA synthetase
MTAANGEREPYVGRLAPSPTGALHLGNVRTFMIAYLRARTVGGRLLFRMEDLDHPRDKPGAADAARRDLEWLGFDWDAEFVQSERRARYRAAIDGLHARGLAYPCVCTRRDVEHAQSAPHEGEQLFYPGTCRGRFADWDAAARVRPQPCWRFRTPDDAVVSFTDGCAGACAQDVARTLGDFPLARDRDGAGYTLAATLDDLAMGVTEVVRGDDLLAATPAQILLRRALAGGRAAPPIRFFHVPLVVGPDGKRLAKRHGDTRIAAYRAAGVAAETIIGRLAATCGWGDGAPVRLAELVARGPFAAIPKERVVVKGASL